MSYRLITAMVRADAIDAGWEELDISALDINHLLQTYRQVWVKLVEPGVDETQVWFNLVENRGLFPLYVGARLFGDWLATNGSTTLPTTTISPQFSTRTVRYSDAYRAGYTVELTDYTRHPDAQLPLGAKRDLLLRRDGIDFSLHGRHCLATVNGLVHRVAGSPHGLYVVDGGRSGTVANDNQVGLLSFANIAPLTLIPISHDMLYKQTPDQKYSDYVMIKSPVDLEDKTVILVIGGYMHVLDSSYLITGSHSIRVDTTMLGLAQRIFDLHGSLDISSLNLRPVLDNPNQFAREDLFSDRTIAALFTLPQSFLVIMPKTELISRRRSLQPLPAPGRFIANDAGSMLPLVTAYGRLSDYMPFYERGEWLICSRYAVRHNYTFETNELDTLDSIDTTRHPYKPTTLPKAWFWEIASAI